MTKLQSWFFYLCALEGAAATAALFLIPSEGGRLSLARLSLISFLLVFSITLIVLGFRRPSGLEKLARPRFILLSAILSLAFGSLLFLLRYLNPENFLSTYQRLSPLLWYLLVLSLQFFFYLILLYKGIHPSNLSSHKPVYFSAFVASSLLFLVLIFIALTRLGVTPDPAYWGEPGVPLLGWQFGLALIGGVVILGLTLAARVRATDFILPLTIYLLAVLLWLNVPTEVLANSFYMPINPPTFQPFPYSDAGYYDQMAHSLLIGHPYQETIPTRPLYIFLLTILHFLFGENYRNIIIGQTFVLAVIPVIFYSLGKKLHSRVAGVTIALFFIFRELTTLWVSSNTRVSNTKTLLVDMPTLLLLILACLSTIRWLEKKDEKSALLAGGMFGLLLLLRTQSMLVLPLMPLAALLVLGWKNKSAYLLASFFFLGLLITVIPWLTHNYLQTGQFAFDAPFQYKVIASQYAYSGNLDIDNFDFEGKGLGRVLIEFALKDPAFVFGFITNHFLAAQIHGVLVLPLIKPYNGIFEPINLYWMEWKGTLEWYNLLLIIFYLAVISLGLGSAWKRWRWIGLLPLAFSAGYALATAIGRFSGWRYDLPADWVWYFYFGIGFAELLFQAALLFGAQEELPRVEQSESVPFARTQSTLAPAARAGERRFQGMFGFALLFALIGALPWMIKNIAAPRYADTTQTLLRQKIASVSNVLPLEQISVFASQPDAFILTGRVLYPRFFSKEDGLASANPWPAYALREYPRIGFLLLNQSNVSVVFPTKRLPEFPHAQDAIIVGCQREDYVEAHWVIFPELDAAYSSEEFPETCSS
jgi:4-amino-4-deoxy-L-arabinose transferase-like glycosyltransferase